MDVDVSTLVPSGTSVEVAARSGPNPLADSGLLGVGAGAALGAVAAVRLGWAGSTFLALPFAAFAGAMTAVLVLYALSQALGGGTLHGLLLTGISVSALAAAGTSMLLVAPRSSA